MCGRYTIYTDLTQLAERFGFDAGEVDFLPSYNVAPTQSMLTVVRSEGNRAELMRWGLIPSWAKNMSIGSRMINARAETVAEKPSFRAALMRRRCLVVADGFYEWQKTPTGKRPMRIALDDGGPFAFAGLWEVWKSPDSQLIKSCTIITTSANDRLRSIHSRMPVILTPDAEELWLDTNIEDAAVQARALVPYPLEDLQAYEVSSLVNSPKNNAPELVVPVD